MKYIKTRLCKGRTIMKTKIKGLLLATGILLTSCGGVKLGQVTNIRFEDGILSFDEVKNAEG